MITRLAPGTQYACRRSSRSWEVREAVHCYPDADDPLRGIYETQRRALGACGRSWFQVQHMLAHLGGGVVVEENRVGEASTVTTAHYCSSPGEAHQLKARLVADGLVYVEGTVP